jgi:hypothetical protein
MRKSGTGLDVQLCWPPRSGCGLWRRLKSVGKRVWRRGEKEGEFVEKEKIFIGEGGGPG